MSRRVDDLGRFVIPVDLRRLFGIHPGDELDVTVEGDAIVLRKRVQGCVFCDRLVDLAEVKGKPVCAGCLSSLRSHPVD